MFARTPRLTLRPGWAEDAPALSQAIGHEVVVANLSRVPWPYTLGDAEAFLAQTPAPNEICCLVFSHEEQDGAAPTLVGGIGLTVREDGHALGYWLTPRAWGRGYATEAAKAVLGTARWTLGLRRIAGEHFLDNPASGRVLTKLGFRPTGRTRPLLSRARGRESEATGYTLDLDDDRCGTAVLMAA